ncbi:MAG: glycine cleavage system protein GcvH [Anaerolineae bacterium]|nr:glycine cleavage system protein GcvH [Anaerolineae bacterium]
MSDQPVVYKPDCKYTETHEWARLEGDVVVVGISDYAQHQLGDVVFVELPNPGKEVEAGKSFGAIESVKAASDVYAPVSGTIVAINDALANQPELVNKDAFGEGWFVKIKPSNPAELDKLLDAVAYQKKVEAGEAH